MSHPDRPAHPHPGRFIALEGLDGCGKTTQAAILAAALRADGESVVEVALPGSTAVGLEIRDLLKHRAKGIDRWADCLLQMASNAQAATDVIRPALGHGNVVIADRFVDSTIAYQGGGYRRGMWRVARVHQTTCGLWPDLTIIIDTPGSDGRREGSDRYEREAGEFWRAVGNAYGILARVYPSVVRIDGAGDPGDVAARVYRSVKQTTPKVCHPRGIA